MKFNKEAVMVGSILVTSFAAFAGTAITAYPEIPAPVATEERDQGSPLEEYGDGCKSYDDAPNWIVCPTEAYSADMAIRVAICEQEDSRNCYWDAQRFGNGQGTSFINIEGVIYTPSDVSE